MECTIETLKINEDCNVIAAETFGGNLKQTVIPYLNNFFCVFLYHTLIFVVLNDKVLANFSSGYPLMITRDFPVHNTILLGFSYKKV